MRGPALALALLAAGSVATRAGAEAGFAAVAALFADRCLHCHSGPGAPMGLDLSSHALALSGGWSGPVLRPGDADSVLLKRLRGEITPRMPLDGPPFLTEDDIALVTNWVMAGLPEGEAAILPMVPRAVPAPGEDVLWPDVEVIFNQRCVKCHSDNSRLDAPPEGLRLSSLEEVLAGGERLAVLPGNPAMSPLWRHITGTASPRMPFDGPPFLDDDRIRLITDWIAGGARDADGQPAPIPVGATIRLRGTLTGEAEIDGAGFVITAATRIDDRPRLGDEAEMRGVVQADGTVHATRFRDR